MEIRDQQNEFPPSNHANLFLDKRDEFSNWNRLHDFAVRPTMRNPRRFLHLVLPALLATAPLMTAQQRRAQPPQSVRLYVFDCGSLNIPDTSPYQLKKEELATTYMSVSCFLVAHPRGTMIWDAGAVPDTAFKSGGGPGTLRYATSQKPLSAQLAEVGYSPADLPYLT